MDNKARRHILEGRQAKYNTLRQRRIKAERETFIDELAAVSAALEADTSTSMTISFDHQANTHWLEANHGHGIPLVLAIRGITVILDLQKEAEQLDIKITRQDSENLHKYDI